MKQRGRGPNAPSSIVVTLVGSAWLMGCGGAAEIAERNRTFYAHETSAGAAAAKAFEARYPPLDAPSAQATGAHRGYAVLDGRVRLSRPDDWALRSASDEPGARYLQYVSPRAFLVSIYERPEPYGATWPLVLRRYEAEAREKKAELLAKRVPVASFGSQGRAFVVRRKVPGAKGAYETLSHEIVARGERRVVLVQIVPQGGDLAPVMGELERFLETLEVD